LKSQGQQEGGFGVFSPKRQDSEGSLERRGLGIPKAFLLTLPRAGPGKRTKRRPFFSFRQSGAVDRSLRGKEIGKRRGILVSERVQVVCGQFDREVGGKDPVGKEPRRQR